MEVEFSWSVLNANGKIYTSIEIYEFLLVDLAERWKHRGHMWFGVIFPSKPEIFGVGGKLEISD